MSKQKEKTLMTKDSYFRLFLSSKMDNKEIDAEINEDILIILDQCAKGFVKMIVKEMNDLVEQNKEIKENKIRILNQNMIYDAMKKIGIPLEYYVKDFKTEKKRKKIKKKISKEEEKKLQMEQDYLLDQAKKRAKLNHII